MSRGGESSVTYVRTSDRPDRGYPVIDHYSLLILLNGD